MLKKCLIAIAVVALLVTTIQAATPEEQPDGYIKREGDWPWTYKELPICTFPVTLEVGHYVQIEECQELEMKLVQVACDSIGKGAEDFPCYSDCVDINARANFPAIFGASFTGSEGSIIGDNEVYWEGGNTIVGGAGWEALKLCMKAWKVDLWGSGQTTGWLNVGTITINVKPPDTV